MPWPREFCRESWGAFLRDVLPPLARWAGADLFRAPVSPWGVLGRSVRGAQHRRQGLPNQDAIGWLPETGTGPPLIAAVSDGHGSTRSFRSHQGAALAVQICLAVLNHFCRPTAPLAPDRRRSRLYRQVPGQLVRAWQAAVAAHWQANPLTPEELSRLGPKGPAADGRAAAGVPLLAYGATLVAVVVTAGECFFLQLGDGDILTVSEGGQVHRPLRHDPRLFANETTSLCSPRAARDFRLGWQPRAWGAPALILVSTDGYANSFRDNAAFLQVAPDLLGMLRTHGVSAVNAELDTWLQESSEKGSGDDVTLAILYRRDAVEPAHPTPLPEPGTGKSSPGLEAIAVSGVPHEGSRPPEVG
jgi:serine/threonine protein phosphatase PrpC